MRDGATNSHNVTLMSDISCLFPVPTWSGDITVTDIREKFAAYLFHMTVVWLAGTTGGQGEKVHSVMLVRQRRCARLSAISLF